MVHWGWIRAASPASDRGPVCPLLRTWRRWWMSSSGRFFRGTARKLALPGQPSQPQPWGKCGASRALRPYVLPPDASSQKAALSLRQEITATPLHRLQCRSCSLVGIVPHAPDLRLSFAGSFYVCMTFE